MPTPQHVFILDPREVVSVPDTDRIRVYPVAVDGSDVLVTADDLARVS